MLQRTLLVSLFVLVLALALLAFPSVNVRAATLCVNPSGAGGCFASIQAAVNAASPGDTINIAAGTYTGTVTINKNNLTIVGAGANDTFIRSSEWSYPANSLVNSGDLTKVSDLAFNGSVSSETGGKMVISNSYFDHIRFGSVVVNGGSVALTNTAIIGCTGMKPWIACVANYAGAVDLANVTISGSQAGSIDNRAPMTLTNVTINDDGNWDFKVGNSGAMTLTNTIIRGGNGTIGNCAYFGGSFISQGHNLSSDNTCPLSAATDMTNTNPLLTPLVSVNGTLVHALQPGSPAIDKGNDALCPPTDQTGFSRPYGPHCDIGAYEWRPLTFYFDFFPLIAKDSIPMPQVKGK